MFFKFFNVHVWERERESARPHAHTGEGQRERETQNPKQPPGSELSATGPDVGLQLTDREIMT